MESKPQWASSLASIANQLSNVGDGIEEKQNQTKKNPRTITPTPQFGPALPHLHS